MINEKELDLKRIQSLTDATFAIAMTLLVLDIKFPTGMDPTQFNTYFSHDFFSDLFIYFTGFVTLGIFWIGSHFHHNIISHTNRVSSWINIFFLMTICLIPFAVSLIRNYRNEERSILLYCCILICASLMNLLMLWYAWKMKHTKEHYTNQHYKNARVRILVPIYIYVLTAVVSFISREVALFFFLIPLLLHIYPEKYSESIKSKSTK